MYTINYCGEKVFIVIYSYKAIVDEVTLKMKDKIIKRILIIILFILVCISFFIPWFTINPVVMGYIPGIIIFPRIISITLIYLAVFLVAKLHDKLSVIVAEVCAVAVIVISILSLGQWPVVWMISDNFKWKLEYTVPTYWISLGIQVLFFIILQIIIKNRKDVSIDNDECKGFNW